MRTLDIAWLAGIIEGEGYIGLKRSKYPLITVGMTDLDVIQRVHGLFGERRNQITICKRDRQVGYKQMYYVSVHGRRSIEWMLTLFPLLGQRRKDKIKEIIDVWKQHSPKRLRRKSDSKGHQGLGIGLLGGSQQGFGVGRT